nr:MAG TPA: hypothetical protein [Caudoviricetes sp.]
MENRMKERLENLEAGALAIVSAMGDMPWCYQVEVNRTGDPGRYEMRAYMLEDPKGLLRDVRPERIDCLGVFWRRARDVGPCTLVMYNTNKMEQAYRAKLDLEPLEEVRNAD